MTRELSEYEYVIERQKFGKQDNGEYGYCWEEVAICKTFEQAASILNSTLNQRIIIDGSYRARYVK